MDTLTIGQLARRVGMRTSALRYYEEQGLLIPAGRTDSGYRFYEPQAEETLRFIQRAQRLGISLADIGILLKGWRDGDLSQEIVIKTAEARYLALERQVTQLLVLQHELELFLRDLYRHADQEPGSPDMSPFSRLLDQVCIDPGNHPAETMLERLMEHTGCILTSSRAQQLLRELSGQHVHIWQEEEDYHILVVSDDPTVGTALAELAQLEARCQAHAHANQAPDLLHNGEGYLLVARGGNAFIFARLFLALETSV